MNISISDEPKNVCIDDHGILVTYQVFIPWRKTCSIADALEAMQPGQIVSTLKADEKHTLALVKDSVGDGCIVLFDNEDGTCETRHTFMGRKIFEYFFSTVDNAQHVIDDKTDPEPMRGTPEWYAWADRHDNDDEKEEE